MSLPLVLRRSSHHRRPLWLGRFISNSTHLRADIRRSLQPFASFRKCSNVRHHGAASWLVLLENGIVRQLLAHRMLLSLLTRE